MFSYTIDTQFLGKYDIGFGRAFLILLGIYFGVYFLISYNHVFKREKNVFTVFFGLLMDLPFIWLGIVSIFNYHQTLDVWGRMLAILGIFVFSFNAIYRFVKKV